MEIKNALKETFTHIINDDFFDNISTIVEKSENKKLLYNSEVFSPELQKALREIIISLVYIEKDCIMIHKRYKFVSIQTDGIITDFASGYGCRIDINLNKSYYGISENLASYRNINNISIPLYIQYDEDNCYKYADLRYPFKIKIESDYYYTEYITIILNKKGKDLINNIDFDDNNHPKSITIDKNHFLAIGNIDDVEKCFEIIENINEITITFEEV